MTMDYISAKNNSAIALEKIPEHDYDNFLRINVSLLNEKSERHCVNYFGVRSDENIRLFCCIADDNEHLIFISSSVVSNRDPLNSFTFINHNFERFERELFENFGITYTDHPWLKPLRYSYDRFDKGLKIENHPFFNSESEELHEVGVGPIHAGIIEPGHFRFICNGEQIMHLEIQLGYQHRGLESMMIQKKRLIERSTLAENIAGDTVAGHTTAFANLWENICYSETDKSLDFTRTMALEIERIAIHTGDLAAICADIAYQLGSSVYGRLRTPFVNFFQEWCGNRLAKGLIRPGKTNYVFTDELAKKLLKVIELYEPDFMEITDKLTHLPSALSRLEKTGVVNYEKVLEIGAVGMAARMSGLARDIRTSHPFNLYGNLINNDPVIKHHGDVYSRVQIRKYEILQSLEYLKTLLKNIPAFPEYTEKTIVPSANNFAISLVEGWRGEICHCAITDEAGKLIMYKIKDPSHHNWMVLAQAVRSNEISDFPICNKSFNLSYCGNDL